MPLHLLKLCVGVASVEDLAARIEERAGRARAAGLPDEVVHLTRMVPSRGAEVLAGGSLYWVVRGMIAARQSLRDLRPVISADGIRRCELVLESRLVPVMPRPCRPFQGWRYLPDDARPKDLAECGGARDMPETLRRELRDLCLL